MKNTKGISIFIIHSKTDKAIPYAESEKLFQSISSNNYKELWLTKDCEHIHSYRLHKNEYTRRVLRFLNKYLKLD
ncbi:prolyl oligopeptidase family serine peptidase [Neobacillus sp. NPDC097160]|uniref:prolyl oligopeptidase family serine peptidase n=1 Tax=Neobacillus sp. NPDC097160 TaxID=3364298 RepID=UPI0038184DB9